MLRNLCCLAATAALFVLALPASAWWPNSGSGNGGFGPGPYPPSYYGYPLDDFTAGYYGGSRYKEYYAFGHGLPMAASNFPGPMPGPIYPYGYREPRPEPCVHYAAPVVPVPAPVLQDPHCALLDVHLPADAAVWLEGNATKQTGDSRQFVSPPLKAGEEYHYEIKARWKQDGRDVEQTKQVTVHAGERLNVTFPTVAATEKVAAPKLLPEQARR